MFCCVARPCFVPRSKEMVCSREATEFRIKIILFGVEPVRISAIGKLQSNASEYGIIVQYQR